MLLKIGNCFFVFLNKISDVVWKMSFILDSARNITHWQANMVAMILSSCGMLNGLRPSQPIDLSLILFDTWQAERNGRRVGFRMGWYWCDCFRSFCSFLNPKKWMWWWVGPHMWRIKAVPHIKRPVVLWFN